jgi:hypothetical protein
MMKEPKFDQILQKIRQWASILAWATLILAIGIVIKFELTILLLGVN